MITRSGNDDPPRGNDVAGQESEEIGEPRTLPQCPQPGRASGRPPRRRALDTSEGRVQPAQDEVPATGRRSIGSQAARVHKLTARSSESVRIRSDRLGTSVSDSRSYTTWSE